MFLRRTAAVSLSGYLFFGSSVDIGSKAVQARHRLHVHALRAPCLLSVEPTEPRGQLQNASQRGLLHMPRRILGLTEHMFF